jgi:protein SCO1/2
MRFTRTTTAAAAFLAAAAVALSGCSSTDSGDKPDAVASVSQHDQKPGGTVLDQPFAKPDLTLTDTHGKPFDLRKETDGHPTLLYFGYTNCPDTCPLVMSNISIAKSKLPKAEQKKLRVVFVTTDPERDTPEALGSWLRAQDPSFIGLTGDIKKVEKAAKSVGVSVAPTHKDENGDIVATHGVQVLAFSPKDDKAHVIYLEGEWTVPVLTKELPKIVEGKTP